MKKILRFDWDVIAGIAAAVIGLVLHLLHVVETGVVLTIILVLLSLLLLRDLRRESSDERLAEQIHLTDAAVHGIQSALAPPDAILIGPRRLRVESQRFAETAQGEMVWFNVCFTMFKTQEVFELLLRPAIENPRVHTIQFVSNENEQRLWEEFMLPKINACAEFRKVKEPRWATLPETVSFILAEVDAQGTTEALLSFWGEPFMSRTTGKQVPRYIFRITKHSDLIAQLTEMERQHRILDHQ
ncbi:MAG: hypothetical protein WEB58_05550 [Planctomycetaceae bacterium]